MVLRHWKGRGRGVKEGLEDDEVVEWREMGLKEGRWVLRRWKGMAGWGGGFEGS